LRLLPRPEQPVEGKAGAWKAMGSDATPAAEPMIPPRRIRYPVSLRPASRGQANRTRAIRLRPNRARKVLSRALQRPNCPSGCGCRWGRVTLVAGTAHRVCGSFRRTARSSRR
jgi:hypothetical protein